MSLQHLKEQEIASFWKMLEDCQFVKSTDSFTGEEESYPPAIQDMEATVLIQGVFDKYAIEEWLKSQTLRLEQAIREELKKNIEGMKKEVYATGEEARMHDYSDMGYNNALNDILLTLK